MGHQVCRRLILTAAVLLTVLPLSAQKKKSEQKDSLVRLMKGTSLELIEKYGVKYRKAIDATFLHNNTYLICDTALWNVDSKLINCWGHVKLMQEETVLTSDQLDYDVDENLAKFRGGVVQLQNKQNNILRTNNLDYNTKDSVAFFRDGGAMKDKDGQVIESVVGNYDSKTRVFEFRDNVNMYTDSVFIKTKRLLYNGNTNKADFLLTVDFWKEDNMLSAVRGWYDRNSETFFFRNNVHGMSKDQEVWCDTLYAYRKLNDVEMRGNIEIKDTTRSVSGVSNYLYYSDSLSRVTMRRDAAITMVTEDKAKNRVDTLYAGADTLIYYSRMKFQIPDDVFKDAKTRLDDIQFDPVSEYRKKAAEAAAKAKADAEAKAAENNPASQALAKKAAMEAAGGLNPDDTPPDEAPSEGGETPAAQTPDSLKSGSDTLLAGADTLLAGADSLLSGADTLLAGADSLAAGADSLMVPDSTKVSFMMGVGNVRIFRKDMQIICDSLSFSQLDSIARFYKTPIVWNEGNRQYTSDSLFVLVKGNAIDRASLMSNAFIITREDSLRFDQIKSTEVMAYFDTTSALRRFDAMGGANAMFYLEENETLSTVNKVESKMLSAILKDGTIDRVYYFDAPKNDAYPVAQMKENEHFMKGFEWKDELRPKGPEDITVLKVRPSERSAYDAHPKAVFKYTDKYFPGYMTSVYKAIEEKRLRKSRKPAKDGDLPDKVNADSLVVSDSLGGGVVAAIDTLAAKGRDLAAARDSLSACADSLAVSAQLDAAAAEISGEAAQDVAPTKKELREEARKLAIARRDARWAELDARDAAKAAAKEQKKLEKKRARTKKAVLRQMKQDAKDEAKLQKYVERFRNKKAREEARAAAKLLKEATTDTTNEQQQFEPSGKRAPEAPLGGDLSTPAEPQS